MVAWLIDSAVRMRRLVVAGVVAVLTLGLVQLGNAPVDVYPEFEQSAVQVQTEALGLSAEEVEQLITTPLEQDLLNGIPWLDSIRSQSMPGLSAIDLTFEPGTDLYLARQMVQERMSQAAALPNVGTPPVMVQPTASTSRVAMVGLRSADVSLIEMSVLARWQMRPRLMAIPGVAQVSIWGQRERQLQVRVDPGLLQTKGVTLTQLIETTGNALWVSPLSFVEASTPGTGGFVETPNQRIGVQHVSPITTSEQLGNVAVEGVAGPPVRLQDVAEVVEDHQPLIGDAGHGGEQALMLVVERFPDADVEQVTADVEDALNAMSAGLKGITVDTNLYRPASYLESATGRLGLAVLVGLALLLLAIGMLTWSWRTVVIAFGSIGTSLVAALYVLRLGGSPLTTMTLLGLATAMALVVDDVVGDVVAIRARMDERRATDRDGFVALVGAALVGRRSPLAYATLIALLAVGPLLLLQGTVGAFARPAVLIFVLAVLASFLVAMIVTPVLAVVLFRGGDAEARVPAFSAWVQRAYDGSVGRTGWRVVPAVVGLALLAALVVAGIPQLRSGALLPALDDPNVLVRLEAAPGTSLAEMDRVTDAAAAELRGLAGVESIGTHTGRAVGADEIVDVDASEIWLRIGKDADHDATLAAIRSTVRAYPGLRSEVSTYAEDRVAAVSVSPGNDLVVRVFGEDYATLRSTAEKVSAVLKTVEGVVSPQVEQQVSQPTVSVQVDLGAAQQHGLRPGDVRREVSTLVSGLTVGSLYEQQAIFDVVVWGGPQTRSSVESLQSLLVHTPSGTPVRLGDVAKVTVTPTPTVISHDGVSRSLDVTAQVRGRDAADVAADATSRLQEQTFPFEYRAEVLGDAVERANAQWQLLLAVAAAGVLSFLLLQAGTSSWRIAGVLLLAAPLAAAGVVLVSALAGGLARAALLGALLAIVALTVRQSLCLVRRAQVLVGAGGTAADALRGAAREQSPAVLVTALGTAAVFLPAAVVGGAGLELLRPFAFGLLGGLVTSVVVVLVLVPGLVAAGGGLRPPPATGFDAPDGERRGAGIVRPRHAVREETDRETGAVMRTVRPWGIASLFVAGSLCLAGCQSVAGAGEDSAGAPASVQIDPAGGPARLTLIEDAIRRIGLQTAPVGGEAGALVIPYAAVVYDADGGTWTFVQLEPGAYQRSPIAIARVDGDTAVLTAGPQPGSTVVTVGAAELVGVEAGISGGE
jgi:Cu/Ag efflux pump CusA